MFGNENVPKDILEYIIFERILTYPYSQWRLHSKILPSWLPPSDPVLYTFEKPPIKYVEEEKKSDALDNASKREKISQEHENISKSIKTSNETKIPTPTLSDISQHSKKKTIGYT